VLQVIEHDPVPPRLLNPKIDHDVETICLKCLEKDPTMRYASAEELGEDLQRYLNGDSISARSFNVLDRIARSLEHDTKTADFSAWSSMILAMAAVVFIEHVTVFLLVWFERERELINLARFLQLVTLAAIFWYHRRDRLMPTNAAERELWTIWIGYFTTYFFIIITMRMLMNNDTIGSDWIERYILELLPYPFISLVSGMAFFIMGSNYWGRCYAIGAVFFCAAPVMALDLRYGPLIFGVVWTIVLLLFSWHLHRQGLRAEQDRAAPPASQADTILFKGQP
jgi:hypothetical protein